MRDVWKLYQRYAEAFDRDRSRAGFEAGWLGLLEAKLPQNARVLELGCGAGEPVARFFIERGHQVTGVDAAPAMIALCRSRFPAGEWIVADMRGLKLGRRFDAVLAWDSFFHLPDDDQRGMFPVFRDHLAPGGLLLFTSGPIAAEAIGDLYGEPLYHASLDASDYEALLAANGMAVLKHAVEDPDCGGHTVWLARAGDYGVTG